MLIIFDLDGTLIDTSSAVNDIVSQLFQEVGIDISPQQVADCPSYTGLGVPEKFIKIAAHYGHDLHEAQYAFLAHEHEVRKGHIYKSDVIQVFEDVETTLKKLKQEGHSLAIGTSNPSSAAHIVLDNLGLSEYFDGGIYGADHNGGQTKPHPGIFEAALDRYTAKDTIIIEDSLAGAEAAYRVGIKCFIHSAIPLSEQEKHAFVKLGVSGFFQHYVDLPKLLKF